MKRWIAMLLTLFTCISITGLSFVDNLILNRIITIIVAASFSIVDALYKLGVIGGKDTFKGVFVIFLICALFLYLGIRKFQEWVISRFLQAKIIVSFVLDVCLFELLFGKICHQQWHNCKLILKL